MAKAKVNNRQTFRHQRPVSAVELKCYREMGVFVSAG